MRTECVAAGKMLQTANPHAHVMTLVIVWKALFLPLGQSQTLEYGDLQFIKGDDVSILVDCGWQHVLSLMRSTKYSQRKYDI